MRILDLKISAPPVPQHLLTRQRLIQKLHQISEFKLVLVSAPAGSGKTTLLSEWVGLNEAKFSVAWVSCGKQDDHSKRFWEYVIAAINSAVGKKFKAWNQVGDKPKIEDVEHFIDWIEKEVKQEVVLVLDDYHFITTNAIHEMLTFFLDLLPPVMHLIIVSRGHPPIPTSQFRVRNQMLEITENDLRFTNEEASAFLKEIISKDLSTGDVETLNSKVEGWVAGLQIAAISLQGLNGVDVKEFAQTFAGSHRSIMDFLVEQVFSQQPESIQCFLLQTSILDRFNVDVCNAIMLRSDGEQNLLWLEEHNLFLIPLDEQRNWFRYHHLFSEFLQRKLHVLHKNEATTLHIRAARWLEEHDFREAAIEHALSGKDFEFANRLLRQIEPQLWGRYDVRTIWRWYDAFPRGYFDSGTNVSLAWQAAIAGDLDDMLRYLQSIEIHHRKKYRPDTKTARLSPPNTKNWSASREMYLTNVDVLRGFRAMFQGRISSALTFLRRALNRTPLDENCMERAHALNYLGHALFWQEDLEEAKPKLIEAARICKIFGLHALHFAALSNLASIQVLQGDLVAAEHYYEQFNQYMMGVGVDVLVGNITGLGEIYLQNNCIAQAAVIIEKGLMLAEMGGGVYDLIVAHIGMARLKQATSDLIESQASLRAAYRLAVQNKYAIFEQLVRVLQAQLWLKQGNISRASYWANKDLPNSTIEVPYFAEIQNITLARVLLAEEHYDSAESLLERLSTNAERGNRTAY